MNKKFIFQYMDGNEEEYESKEYPTFEEAALALKELEDEGYKVSGITELRE